MGHYTQLDEGKIRGRSDSQGMSLKRKRVGDRRNSTGTSQKAMVTRRSGLEKGLFDHREKKERPDRIR